MTIENVEARLVHEDIMTMPPKYETLAENLYWAWANWEVIKIATDGKVKPFDRLYYMMRQKFFKLYMQGSRHITDLYTFNKEKLCAGDFFVHYGDAFAHSLSYALFCKLNCRLHPL